MVAQETVVANVSQGFSETQNYQVLLQEVSDNVHAFKVSGFDHK